jgi:hypothetical protein
VEASTVSQFYIAVPKDPTYSLKEKVKFTSYNNKNCTDKYVDQGDYFVIFNNNHHHLQPLKY